MASWFGRIALLAVMGPLGPSAWGQTAQAEFDFDLLQRSLNLQGHHDGPLLGMMPFELGIDRSNFATLPSLSLSEDGSTASWTLNMRDVLGEADASAPPVPLNVVFEQIDDNRYQFQGTSQWPLAAILPAAEIAVGADQTFDLTFKGVWHADVQAIGQIAMDMNGFELNDNDTAISFGGFDFFAGAWTDYDGDVQFDLSGLEPSTAQVMIGALAPINIAIGGDFETIKFNWQGMQLEAVQAVPADSEHQVANVMYGSPEILAANRQLSQALDLMDATDGNLGIMTLMGEPLTALFAEIPIYSEVEAYAALTTLPMSVVFSQWGDTWSLDVENIRISSAKQPGTPADGDFTVDVGPVIVKAEEVAFGFERLLASVGVSDFDYAGFSEHASALLRPEGSWGDLSGLILTALSGLSEEIYVEGLKVSGLEAMTAATGFDLGNASKNGANPEMRVDNIWGRIALEDITTPSGAVLTYENGLEGLAMPWDAIAGDSISARYWTREDDGLGDLIPTDAYVRVQVANIPLARWQAQMEVLSRRASILDFDGLASEVNILAAAGFQFLALIATDPLVLTANVAVGNEVAALEAEARYLLDFMTPETLGSGEGHVTIVQGDFLLQRLMRVNKSLSRALREPDAEASIEDYDFLDTLIAAIRQLSEMRALADVTSDGDWQFTITLDPEFGVMVNGLPGAEAGLLLGN